MRDPATGTTTHRSADDPDWDDPMPTGTAWENWRAARRERRQPEAIRRLGPHAGREGATDGGHGPGAVPPRSAAVGIRRWRVRAVAEPRVRTARSRAVRDARLVMAASVTWLTAFVVFVWDRNLGTGIDLLVMTGLWLATTEELL